MNATMASSHQPDPRKYVATLRPRLDVPIECEAAADAIVVLKNAPMTSGTAAKAPCT